MLTAHVAMRVGKRALKRILPRRCAVSVLAAPVALLALAPLEADAQDCPPGLEVLVERPYADAAALTPGSTVVVRSTIEAEPCNAVVAGIFEPPPDPATLNATRPRVLFHLPHLQTLSARRNEVDYFTVATRPGTDLATLAADLEPLLPGAQVLPVSEVAERSSTTFRVVSRFHTAIALITLIAGGVFLGCIMILKVQERRLPIAAARLTGIPRRLLFWWTVAEAAMLSTLGGAAGLGVGVASSAVVNAYYQRYYDTTLVFSQVTGVVVMEALALAVLLGMAAGVFAATRLLASNPLDEMGR
ncbi:MAG: FtsX-like permease family protein [Gemmatimonadetes bacterium]|nr:FtsX-like permease family protein [Gemmatimonadota bacterium]MYG21924.1 FtsX-like permease family protein [Gemmatimonadota bacterium]MYJ39388.1 FtsX-like permease family protein [Gemmatimonadota bacterium]